VPVFLCGDPGRLRQILINLAGNAVKFTAKGEIAVLVSLLSENSDDVVLRFSIKDTGIGIAADKQQMLFQKFTQADSSTSRKFGGTGLGLAISKQLSEMMGGEIGLVSTEGKGSEFFFTARFVKQVEKAYNTLCTREITGMHVLVVDDNATSRDVLMSQLKVWGVIAEEAADGLTALSALYRARETANPFIGAILDMQMPGMNGVVLAQTIKADDTLKNTRLVLMTSGAEKCDAQRGQEIGFAAYLMKPVRQSDLYSCLSVVLSGSAISQSPKVLITRPSIREIRKGTIRILLAEDNIVNQQVALGILKKQGFRADAVANGLEVITSLETIPYDLVLMDVQMPEMDGYEATRFIREPNSCVANHAIPIIAMTANAMQGDREKCLKAGMNDYVTKPISPEALVVALDKWLPHDNERLATPAPLQPACANVNTFVFDYEGLMKRLMDDTELARKVTDIFFEEMPKQISELGQAVLEGDCKKTEHCAHTIKGAAGNIGIDVFGNIAATIESAGRAADLSAAPRLIPELEKQYELAVQEIRKRILPISEVQSI
jgi:CheY-like chemotaxis protein/HPt (histidine-containing phosphotransfer) domain-containing protein